MVLGCLFFTTFIIYIILSITALVQQELEIRELLYDLEELRRGLKNENNNNGDFNTVNSSNNTD